MYRFWRRAHNFYHGSNLFLALGLLSLLGFALASCNGAPRPGEANGQDRPADSSITQPVTEQNSNEIPQAQEVQDDGQVMPIGGIGAVKDKTVCDNTGGILAYADTENYEIYICSDRNNPTIPRYYRGISKTGKGGLELEAKGYNPLQQSYYEFVNYDYTYVVQIPSTQFPQPELIVEFPNGDRHVEKILSYHTGQQRDVKRNVADRTAPSAPTEKPTIPVTETTETEVISYIHKNIDSLGVCEYGFTADSSKDLSTVDPLGNNRYMVQLLCFMGAYQGSYSFAIYSESASAGASVDILSLDVYEPDASGAVKPIKTRAIGGLPTFDPGSQILTVFSKGRGLGDCGSLAHYELKNNQFELIEYRAKFDCDGNYVDPGEYPVIYP
ncbi:protein of unknown function DUF1176 [Thalassoporum mexicanum PCC 7367]|uniref:DUF1176 domain-containing protein n=1 Tax=Thalassoporum mexicanum TaxID=3457544 RepID=UPI00029FC2CD|nr:DUF1176 domain-containing protein [Pseudanabaena sp. PCC 7367]AFY69336.1 protein of unknown function DUF1176 [Pseudanabaena sp. PCC 7367]